MSAITLLLKLGDLPVGSYREDRYKTKFMSKYPGCQAHMVTTKNMFDSIFYGPGRRLWCTNCKKVLTISDEEYNENNS
jgi:hypothetical protein